MTSQLILSLGDDPRDAEVITSALEELGITCDVFRVHKLDDFIAAIDKGGFDIIFTDRTMPGFEGLTSRAIEKDPSSKYTVYVHFTDKRREINISALLPDNHPQALSITPRNQ